MECVSHTINNIVQDILLWILWENKDRRVIHNTINKTLIEEEELRDTHKGKLRLINFYELYLLIFIIDLHPIRRIRKIVTLFKYSHINNRTLENQINLMNIPTPHAIRIGNYYSYYLLTIY